MEVAEVSGLGLRGQDLGAGRHGRQASFAVSDR